ncbi:MAG TPA: Deoxyuridine 5'-triphosphate nucleotidohydrolase [Hyphomicrobiaceae bacterium MAG_BT-2024]
MSQLLPQPILKIKWLDHGKGMDLPRYQTTSAAGLDLFAALGPHEVVALKPSERTLIPTGLSIELPNGFEAQIRPRSGLALRYGVTVLNSPGTVDSDYRGEIKIVLVNLGDQIFKVKRGQRVAQLIVAPIVAMATEVVTELSVTSRGTNGFGSTG